MCLDQLEAGALVRCSEPKTQFIRRLEVFWPGLLMGTSCTQLMVMQTSLEIVREYNFSSG